MGRWHKVKPRPYSPCNGCDVGYASVSQKEVNGKFYEKFDYCQETCQIYKDWLDGKPERFFGENIREAIRTIKGK